jgi:hypothetical protein
MEVPGNACQANSEAEASRKRTPRDKPEPLGKILFWEVSHASKANDEAEASCQLATGAA